MFVTPKSSSRRKAAYLNERAFEFVFWPGRLFPHHPLLSCSVLCHPRLLGLCRSRTQWAKCRTSWLSPFHWGGCISAVELLHRDALQSQLKHCCSGIVHLSSSAGGSAYLTQWGRTRPRGPDLMRDTIVRNCMTLLHFLKSLRSWQGG